MQVNLLELTQRPKALKDLAILDMETVKEDFKKFWNQKGVCQHELEN